MPIQILGIPLSVSCSGYVCPKEELEYFSKLLEEFKLVLILNTEGELYLPFAQTLGTYELDLDRNEINLTKNSRVRLRKAKRRGKDLEFKKISSWEYNEEHYALYEQVYERSVGKLEKLNIDYFKQMDAELYEIRKQSELLAFLQIKQSEKDFIFLFCGVDKRKNLIHDTYLNLLMKIIELARQREASKVHLGQTTGYSKRCVGGVKKVRYMQIASKYLPKWLVKITLGLLGNPK